MSRLTTFTLERARTAFTWDAASQRYRLAASGRFVKREAVKRALLRVVDGTKGELRELARRMAEGTLPVGDWQAQAARKLKSLHLASHAAARGGFGQLTAADYGRVGSTLRFVYGRLERFAGAAARGELSGPQIEARAALYSSHAAATHENARRYGAQVAGYTLERNVLGVGESCRGCIEQTERGWVRIGELVPVGQRLCLANCRCSLRFSRGDGSPA